MWSGHSNFGKSRADIGSMVRAMQHTGKADNQMAEVWATALWCKVGQHSFDPDDPDKHSFAETRTVQRLTGNSYGSPVYQDQEEQTGRITVCGPCYAKTRPFQQSPQAIPPGVDKQTYTEYLESQAGLRQDTLSDQLPNDFPG